MAGNQKPIKNRDQQTKIAAIVGCYFNRNLVGQGRGRTADTRIFSPLLYQLSYLAAPSLGEFPAGATH
jgi:hypothetical protein